MTEDHRLHGQAYSFIRNVTPFIESSGDGNKFSNRGASSNWNYARKEESYGLWCDFLQNINWEQH